MKAGRKPIYRNCLDFDAMCELYFDECDSKDTPEPYLKSGLALFLGLSNETIRAYAADKENQFSAVTKRCFMRIQNDLEKRSILNGKQAVGCLFNLKCNFGMIEASKLEVTGNNGGPIETKSKLSIEEAEKELKIRGIPIPNIGIEDMTDGE